MDHNHINHEIKTPTKNSINLIGCMSTLYMHKYSNVFVFQMSKTICVSYSSTNHVENSDGGGLILPEPHSPTDQLTSEPISGPASVATSDQHEQFVTPQNSSPSMHSLSNSSLPTTPPSNTAVDDLISEAKTESTLRDDTNTGLNGDVMDSGFILIDHPVDNCDITGEVDVEDTLRPTGLPTTVTSTAVIKRTTDFNVEEDAEHDTLIPAHLRVIGIHGNNMRTKASMQVEDRVIGLPDNNHSSINSEQSSLVTSISNRRNSGTLPMLKIASYGANSPEYFYTPTDSMCEAYNLYT